jgi:hypothetical protein
MKINIELPVVTQCTIDKCAYNIDNKCHAKAITIGDGASPGCDTLFSGSEHIKAKSIQAGVGACKVDSCVFNNDLECTADGISVGLMNKNVQCLTYTMR